MQKVRPKLALISPIIAVMTVLFIHYVLITYGTGDLVGTDLRGASYDSLGDSLLQGKADVRPDTVGWEGFDIGGKKYMYFGLVPALPRIVLNAIWPQYWGQWSRVCSLFASFLALVGAWSLVNCALTLNQRWSPQAHRYLVTSVILGIGLGSPLFYLMSSARIYHEAIVWGLAASMWGLYGAFSVLCNVGSSTRPFLILSASAGLALLARVTFGIPLYLVLALLLVRESRLWLWNGTLSTRALQVVRLALVASPALISIVVQLWYNSARFSSVWIFKDYRYFYLQPDLMGGVFAIRRLPILFDHYFGLSLSYFLPSFPFVRMFPESYHGASFFWHSWREPTISLLFASPWLIVGGLWGAGYALTKKEWWQVGCLLTLGSQVITILSYYFSTQRFAAEFIPWLTFGLALLCASAYPWSWRRWVVSTGVVAFSVLCTVGSTVYWIAFYASNLDVPNAWRATLIERSSDIPTIPSWDGERVYLDTLPRRESFTFEGTKVLRDEPAAAIRWAPARFNHGLWAHARSKITVDVPSGSTAFESIVAIPFEALNCLKLTTQFSAVTDNGEEIVKSEVFTTVVRKPHVSGPTRIRTSPQFFRVNLPETKSLTLILDDAGDGHDCDHGIWLMPAFLIPAENLTRAPLPK